MREGVNRGEGRYFTVAKFHRIFAQPAIKNPENRK